MIITSTGFWFRDHGKRNPRTLLNSKCLWRRRETRHRHLQWIGKLSKLASKIFTSISSTWVFRFMSNSQLARMFTVFIRFTWPYLCHFENLRRKSFLFRSCQGKDYYVNYNIINHILFCPRVFTNFGNVQFQLSFSFALDWR